ncbi:uncharacterized protein LOC121860515 [Homarus americanus]|uniref:uncharacterized protein LOC121860515 n=1 Tax=Homarus americanus TaxID=6706 RepID=UPI001C4505B5|nr:uncharacterized protein LOC121860515 [Homarus americanus]
MSTVVMKTVKGGRAVCVAVNGTVRYKHTLEQQQQQQQKKLHHQVSGTTTTAAAFISMPANVEELSASHKARFSPRRTRDVSSKLTQVGSLFGSGFMSGQGTQGGTFNSGTQPIDSHIDVYDSRITVSLSSVMQTNVPKPYEISAGSSAPQHARRPVGAGRQVHLRRPPRPPPHDRLLREETSGVDMTGIIKALGINVGMVTEEGAASGVGDVSGRWSSGGAISDCRGDRPDY